MRAQETFRYCSGDLLFRQPSTLVFLWGNVPSLLQADQHALNYGDFLSPAKAWARDPGRTTVSFSS